MGTAVNGTCSSCGGTLGASFYWTSDKTVVCSRCRWTKWATVTDEVKPAPLVDNPPSGAVVCDQCAVHGPGVHLSLTAHFIHLCVTCAGAVEELLREKLAEDRE